LIEKIIGDKITLGFYEENGTNKESTFKLDKSS